MTGCFWTLESLLLVNTLDIRDRFCPSLWSPAPIWYDSIRNERFQAFGCVVPSASLVSKASMQNRSLMRTVLKRNRQFKDHCRSALLGMGLALIAVDDAGAQTAGDILEKTSPDHQLGYINGVVEGLAYARFLRDRPNETGMRCIYDWYLNGDGRKCRPTRCRSLACAVALPRALGLVRHRMLRDNVWSAR